MVQNSKKRILILGASGLLGSTLSIYLEKYFDIILCSYKQKVESSHRVYANFDVRDRDNFKSLLLKLNPDYIINCIALTDVDLCEKNNKLAYDLNVEVVQNIISSCSKQCKLIHISTDYVFDGTKAPYKEEDIPNPTCYYGKTKLEAENLIRSSNKKYIIFRTSVLFNNSTNHNFYNWVRLSLKNKDKIKVVTDQISNPTWTWSLSEAIFKSIINNIDGLFHFAGNDILSRYDFSLRIALASGFQTQNIVPISSDDLNQKARRPLNTSLENNKIQKILDIDHPTLDFVLKQLENNRLNTTVGLG